MITAHVLISGHVQGVAFRYFTQRMARKQSLGGWVRNLDDGRVEAEFQGPRKEVEEAVQWCRRGSPTARVTEVVVDWPEESERYRLFEIRSSRI